MSATLVSFYLNPLKNNEEDVPLHLLTPEIYENWTTDEQVDFVFALCDYIKINMPGLEIIPDFLLTDKDILLALGHDIWSRSDEEIERIKSLIKESRYSRNWDFIEELMTCDDGSLALSVADETLRELPEFWIAFFVVFDKSPREYHLNPGDAEIAYSPLPENFRNNAEFNLELMAKVPYLYPAFCENVKQHPKIQEAALANYIKVVGRSAEYYNTLLPEDMKGRPVLCESILKSNGLMLAKMPDACKANPELAYIAIMQNPAAMECIHDDLTYDVDFIKKTIADCPEALQYSIPRVKYVYENG